MTGPTAGATSTNQCWSAVASGCAPPGSLRTRTRSTSSSILARPSAPAPTQPPASASSSCCELEEAGEAHGPLTDLGTGSGVLAIAASKLGWDPVEGYDHEPPALEAAAANAAANGVRLALQRANLRETLPPLPPTVVANMTAPILQGGCASAGSGGGSRGIPCSAEQRARLRRTIPGSPTLVLSGLLPTELDEVAAAFAPAGMAEAERRQDGDWAALLLRRG